MTTPTPDRDPLTERVEPIPADQLPPASAGAPAPGIPTFAPPEAPAPQATFAAPEPASFPTQPVTPVAPGVSPSATPSRSGGGTSPRVLNLVLGVAVLVAVAGIAFAVGRTTAPASTSPVANVDPNQGGFGPGPNDPNGNGGNGPLGGGGPDASFDLNGNGNGGPGGFDDDGDRGRFLFGGGLGIQGTVQSVTADSITIQLDNGPTITFGIDGSTTYHQQADASASDVSVGSTVIVNPADGFRPDRDAFGNGNGNGGLTLGTAGSITVVP